MEKVINVTIRRAKILSASNIMAYEVSVEGIDGKAEFCFIGEKNLEAYVEPLKKMAENVGFTVNVIWEGISHKENK